VRLEKDAAISGIAVGKRGRFIGDVAVLAAFFVYFGPLGPISSTDHRNA
jgi:hypothetical protein